MTNRYLDVAVVRIQGYLTRAPNLKSRRGASTMISEASRKVREGLPGGVEVNTEAGAVDGVVSLRLSDGVDHKVVACSVFSRLRKALPAAELHAVLSVGPTYTAARDGKPKWEEDWLPAVPEWPLAKTCDWCRTWPATPRDHEVTAENAKKVKENYCPDCALREENAGAATDRREKRRPGPEKELLGRMPGGALPDDFDALARLGAEIDHTHIVTIYADGNSIGDYMKAQNHRPDLATEIHEATWTAVTGTVTALALPGDGPLPVIPHLVGGDDVLISLPAHEVWPGVLELLTRFGGRFTTGEKAPTLSAGVVVHHRKHPLSDVIDLAGGLLRAAKQHHTGHAAFAWHSVTHDGPVRTDRPPVRLTVLDQTWQALADLHAEPASARQQLGRLCREDRDDPTALDAHVERLGLASVVAPFQVGDGIGLEDALGMLRWWKP